MPAFKNDHNGDVVTVTGVNAARLDALDNWHRVKSGPEAAVKPKRAKRGAKPAPAKPAPAKPAKAEVVEPAESGTPTTT